MITLAYRQRHAHDWARQGQYPDLESAQEQIDLLQSRAYVVHIAIYPGWRLGKPEGEAAWEWERDAEPAQS